MLVRRDLSPSYQAVQAGHAVAEHILRVPSAWNNGTLVYLSVPDEDHLKHWGKKMTRKNIKWVGFREPDIGNELTAIAAVHDGKVFNKLNLL